MSKGLRLIKLSEASSPTKVLHGFSVFSSAGQLVSMFAVVRTPLSYQSSAGCEPAQWPSLAWWVLSWAEACPQTQLAGRACTWLDRPWFPVWQTHTVHSCKMSVCKSPLEVQNVQDLPEWEQRYWCPDHWLHRWECSTPPGEVDWKETVRTVICCVNSSKPLSEH